MAKVTKRKPHHKSRNGCRQCKQRHVKCDERRPTCVNCTTSNQRCSYLDQLLLSRPSGLPWSPPSSTLTSSSISGASPLPSNVADDVVGRPNLDYQFNLNHLALLHHLETIVSKPPYGLFLDHDTDSRVFFEMVFNSAMSAPYLMDELLAFSALHLSVFHPDASAKTQYSRRAAELQTRALTQFNAACPEIHDDNCMAMFIFSSLLGLHSLLDAVTSNRDFSTFLDRFIQFLSLHRGVRTFAHRGWHIIRQTEIKPVIDMIELTDQLALQRDSGSSGGGGGGEDCDRLLDLLESSKDRLGSVSSRVCCDAVKTLKWSLGMYSTLPEGYRTHIIMAWPVLISAEFEELLKQRRPEALVVLAHWGVLLHYARDWWIFNDAGRFLIESVSRHVGAYWDPWLRWPRQVLSTL